MAYKLRFVQKIVQGKKNEFLELEKQFSALEKASPHMPQGRRFLPVAGREPANTLIWECEFGTLEELASQLQAIYGDAAHEELLQRQLPYMEDNYVEIYEVLA